MSPVPFHLSIAENRLERLKQKLALTDLPDGILDSRSPWQRGPPLDEIQRLLKYWQNEYDWRQAEEIINRLPQYEAAITIEGFGDREVHFVHQTSPVVNAIPLLFLHGWPGSFLEVTRLLASLSAGDDTQPAFHVVAPSLIDHGFSAASGDVDFGLTQHAEIYHKLMQTLGYKEYVIQAGDVGQLIARFIAINYGPIHCKAHHINSPSCAAPTEDSNRELYDRSVSEPLTSTEQMHLQRAGEFAKNGLGYYALQSTRPSTIGYSLRDSPVGLLAWMYEKIHDWSDDWRKSWSDEEVITWVCIHYFSRAGPEAPSSLYWAIEHNTPESGFKTAQQYNETPLGISRLMQDVVVLPSLWARGLGPVVYEAEYEAGGHFAAWEQPQALTRDLQSMFGRDGGAYGVVSGMAGYDA